MTAITASVGADIAPLKKGLDDAAALSKATSKRVADDQKKATKEAEKAQADATKSHLEGQQRIKEGLTSLTGNLFRAQTGAQAASAGIGMIGDALKLGVVGTVGVQAVGAIVDRIDDAVESTERFREAFSKAVAPRSGAAVTSMQGIEGHLQEQLAGADQVQELLRAPIASGVKEGLAAGVKAYSEGSGSEAIGGLFKGIWSAIKSPFVTDETETKNAARLAEIQKKVDETTGSIVAKEAQLFDIREKSLHVSEEMAAAAEVDRLTAEKRGALNDKRLAAERLGIHLDLQGQFHAADKSAELEKQEIKRRAEAARHDQGEAATAQAARAAAGIAGQISPVVGARDNIAETRRQAADKRAQSQRSDISAERREQLMGEARGLAIDADAAERSLNIDRAQMTPAQLRDEDRAGREKLTKFRAFEARARDERDRAGRGASHVVHAGDRVRAQAEILARPPALPAANANGKSIGEQIGDALLAKIQGATFVIKNT